HRAPLPPRLPTVQEALGPRAEPYEAVFAAFRRVRGPVVAGDTSLSTLFALPPWDCVDLCTCMGGSISLALGAMLAGFQDVWAVTGDFSFVAAGHLGLLEAAGRGLPLKVLIFWNGRAAATGGQPVDPALFEGILAGYPGRVARVGRHHGPQAIEQVLRQAASSPGLRLVVADVA
ncbi:MAG TPA: thiamine pyrophosphate-dependent enzyme, partial [Candidatus Nitrosotenuis sp.]|nr:thiamine pyrophosphate-dependent enzyme [Candidatus Nitrosotenuis sp.]